MFKLTQKSSWVTSHPWFLYSIYDRITRQISWVTSHPWFLYSVYAKITPQISWVISHPWFLYSVYVRILRQISWVTTHPWFYIVRFPRQISWVTAHPWFLYRGLQQWLSLFRQQFVSTVIILSAIRFLFLPFVFWDHVPKVQFLSGHVLCSVRAKCVCELRKWTLMFRNQCGQCGLNLPGVRVWWNAVRLSHSLS